MGVGKNLTKEVGGLIINYFNFLVFVFFKVYIIYQKKMNIKNEIISRALLEAMIFYSFC